MTRSRPACSEAAFANFARRMEKDGIRSDLFIDQVEFADTLIINKTDLLPYVTFDIEKARAFIQQVKHDLPVIEVSCTTGEGLSQWYEWLKSKVPAAQEA